MTRKPTYEDLEERIRVLERESRQGEQAEDENGRLMGAFSMHTDITQRKEAEEALKESEERFRIIASSTPDHLIVQNRDLKYTLVVNPQLGLTEQDMLGKTDHAFLGEEDANVLTKMKKQVLETGKPVSVKVPLLSKTGKKEFFEGSYIPKYDADGHTDGLIGYFRNVTERVEAEQLVRESEEKYRRIVDTTSEGIWTLDENFLITYANKQMAEMLGYEPDELIGKNVRSFGFDEDIPTVLEARNRRKQGISEQFDRKFRRKDGSTLWAHISATPTTDDNGRFAGSFAMHTDITERKRAEADLKASKDFMRAVLDNLNDFLLLIDPVDYTVLGANKAFLDSYGLDKDTVMGKRCYELTHNMSTPCSLPDHICPLEETLRTGKHATVEHIHYDSRGSKLYVEVSAIPIIDKEGEINQIIHLSRDITKRKRAEEALQRTNLELLAIIDNLPFLAWLKDSDGRFLAVNEPFARSCGLSSPSDLVGKTDLDIWPEHLAEAYRADDFEVMHARQKKAVEELIDDQGVEKWFETYKAPLYDAKDNVIGTTGFSRDITERKLAEEQLQKTLDSLRKAVNTTIQVMVSAVEIRDPFTAGHQTRSANLARAIATELGLAQEKIDGIYMACTIHDIGNLSIPADILSRPAKLSGIEFSLVKEHALRGFEMLKYVESPWPLAEIIYQHHERMDGSGYPRNLKGDEILIEASILAVADVVEAMASHRPYRPALGIEAALNEIERNRGILYDSTVADACLRLFREKGFQRAGT